MRLAASIPRRNAAAAGCCYVPIRRPTAHPSILSRCCGIAEFPCSKFIRFVALYSDTAVGGRHTLLQQSGSMSGSSAAAAA